MKAIKLLILCLLTGLTTTAFAVGMCPKGLTVPPILQPGWHVHAHSPYQNFSTATVPFFMAYYNAFGWPLKYTGNGQHVSCKYEDYNGNYIVITTDSGGILPPSTPSNWEVSTASGVTVAYCNKEAPNASPATCLWAE